MNWRCFFGRHEWRRCRFVALNEREPGLMCNRCNKWREAEQGAK